MAKKLDKEVLRLVLKKTGSKSLAGVRVRISELRRKFSGLTPHAAAQLYAEKFGKSIMYKLDDEDRQSLHQARIQGIPQRPIYLNKERKSPSNNFEYLEYLSNDKFERKHIEEINRAYNAHCYMATYVLCRKVIENLVIGLLRKRLPRGHAVPLYWDKARGRFHDFNVILKNLGSVKNKFPGHVQKAVMRLVSKAGMFSRNANDQVHSLFYIATKRELDEARVDEIFELIKTIDEAV